MKKRYHIQITRQALEEHLSSRALNTIIKANTKQDRISGQLGHPEYHYDDSEFELGDAYVDEQRRVVLTSLDRNNPVLAWQSFGRLTHAVQDYYAHSNYTRLWLQKNGDEENHPKPEDIEPLADDIISSPDLISGRFYLPWEVFSFLGFASIMLRLLPEDSHTHLNLDCPEQGPLFEYAVAAACKRTSLEFDQLRQALSHQELDDFTDKANRNGASSTNVTRYA